MKLKEKNSALNWPSALRRLRDSLGESQESMAKRIGVSYRGYRFWEQGKRIPGGKWVKKFYDLSLEMEVEKLSTGAVLRDYSVFPGAGPPPLLTQEDISSLKEALDLVIRSGRPDLIEQARRAIRKILGDAQENELDNPLGATDTLATVTKNAREREERPGAEDPQVGKLKHELPVKLPKTKK
jgi:transcriptional regulator with XRE-family HTH domain